MRKIEQLCVLDPLPDYGLTFLPFNIIKDYPPDKITV